jgi:4-amino-4-deoxy-L-arabinose transferase-like glycosyltransferase
MGRVWLRRILTLIVVGLAFALYQNNEAKNFRAPEAMDLAQLGRNLAAGQGYTTGVIRPLSLHLLEEHAVRKGVDPRTVLVQRHPDLENPPVYPAILAVVFKVMPVSWWARLPADEFHRRPMEEVVISGLNLGFFAVVVVLAGLLGTRLFDSSVGVLSAALIIGTDLFWQFANSGLPTLLLMVLMLLLLHLMLGFEREAASETPRRGRQLLLAVGSGVVVGVMFLTQYSFGWMLFPVLGFLVWRSVGVRGRVLGLALVAFLVLSGPWVARNLLVCGQPLGTAGFAALSGTESFPGDRLQRSQHPVLEADLIGEVVAKVVGGVREILGDDLIRMGGTWTSLFFLVGLLVPFGSPSLNRLRWTLAGMLAVVVVVQAGLRGWITKDFGPVTSEDLLVVLAPGVMVWGSGFLITLIDQIEWEFPFLRTWCLWGLVTLFSAPFLLGVLPPKGLSLSEPYRPSVIREFADFTPKSTLFMSDIPWAVAWYGPRECVWNSLRVSDTAEANVRNRREDFFVFTEARRPIEAVYISPYWADMPFRPRFIGDLDFEWGRFYLEVLRGANLPSGFPLKHVLGGPYMAAGHFLLAAKPWWKD